MKTLSRVGFLFLRSVLWATDENGECVNHLNYILSRANIRKHYEIWPCVHISKTKLNLFEEMIFISGASIKICRCVEYETLPRVLLMFSLFRRNVTVFCSYAVYSEREIRRVNCVDHFNYMFCLEVIPVSIIKTPCIAYASGQCANADHGEK